MSVSSIPLSSINNSSGITNFSIKDQAPLPIKNETDQPKAKPTLKSLLSYKIGYMTSSILEGSRRVADFSYQVFSSGYQALSDRMLQINQMMKITSLFDVAFMPFIVANLGKHVREFKEGDRESKIDSAISIIGEIGLLGRSLTIITMGLVSIRAISSSVLNWTTPLFLVTSVLSLASTLSNYRTFQKMRNLEQQFVKQIQLNQFNHETTLETYQKTLDFIISKTQEDHLFTLKAFNCPIEKLMVRLADIQAEASHKLASDNLEEQLEGRQQLDKTLKSLKGHIHHVGNSSAISAVTSVVGFIAAIILFASPIAPITYTIASIGLIISLGSLINHKIVEYRCSQDLGLKRKWHEWITC